MTLRNETEWEELVTAGWNRLAPPTNGADIVRSITAAVGSVGKFIQPYGEGDAAEKIVKYLGKSIGG